MADTKYHAVYMFKQHAEEMRRETDRTEPVNAKILRRGIIMLDEAQVDDNRIRNICEFAPEDEYLDTMLKEISISREELAGNTAKKSAENEIEIGIRTPMDVASDLFNTRPTADIDGEIALGYNNLWYPTVTPSLTQDPHEENEPWQSKVKVSCGSFELELSYLSVFTGKNEDVSVFENKFDEMTAEATINQLTLHLTAGGSWTIWQGSQDAAPDRIFGRMTFTACIKGFALDRNVDVIVAETDNHFALIRKYVSFDEENVYPAALIANDDPWDEELSEILKHIESS